MKRKLKQISVDAESLNGLRYPSIESGLSVQKYIEMVLDVLGVNRKMQVEFKKILQENGFEFIGKSLPENETKVEENDLDSMGKLFQGINEKGFGDLEKVAEEINMEVKGLVGNNKDTVIHKDGDDTLKGKKTNRLIGGTTVVYEIDDGGVALSEVKGIKGVPKNGYVKRSGKVFLDYNNKIYHGAVASKYNIGGKEIKIEGDSLIGTYKT